MAKPAVDGLERRLESRLRVAHVDVTSDTGRELAARYSVTVIPAFVLVAPGGEVLYRQVGGRPDALEIERRLAAARTR